MRSAALWSAVWLATGVGFAYPIEKSLSADNILVFARFFSYFGVPAAFQHRVLFWGIFGALVARTVFIAAGAALMDRFDWTVYLFGGFLVFTGIKMLRHRHHEPDRGRNPVVRLLGRLMPVTDGYRGQRLLVREAGRWLATPLLVALVVVETTNVLFAVDSTPAIFAVTTDPFLVLTSNAFAILGLRALYFLLAGMITRFAHLKPGLAAVLAFVGAKLSASHVYHVPIWLSLAVIAALIGGSIAASLLTTRRSTDAVSR